MKRLERLEKKGYKITIDMNSGTCFATKNNGLTKLTANSITAMHRKIFGY